MIVTFKRNYDVRVYGEDNFQSGVYVKSVDNIDMGQMFEFSHESEETDLEEVEDEVISYLQNPSQKASML